MVGSAGTCQPAAAARPGPPPRAPRVRRARAEGGTDRGRHSDGVAAIDVCTRARWRKAGPSRRASKQEFTYSYGGTALVTRAGASRAARAAPLDQHAGCRSTNVYTPPSSATQSACLVLAAVPIMLLAFTPAAGKYVVPRSRHRPCRAMQGSLDAQLEHWVIEAQLCEDAAALSSEACSAAEVRTRAWVDRTLCSSGK